MAHTMNQQERRHVVEFGPCGDRLFDGCGRRAMYKRGPDATSGFGL